MKSYKHQIAKSKLEKLRLNDFQIVKVYSYKTKAKQLLVAKRFASANKAARAKKFYKTSLAQYVTTKQITKLAEYAKTAEFKKLSERQRFRLERKYFKLTIKLSKIQEARAKTKQMKQDIREARQYKLDMLRGRIVAGEKRYYINRTTEDSYNYNGTLQTSDVEYVKNHYPDELEKLIKGEKDSDGNWIQEPMPFSDAINQLFEEAIATGDIAPLAQGGGYGYIDETNKEIISPI